MNEGIVGRDRELGGAYAFLDALRTDGNGLLIEGEPGIGKTAVLQAVLEDAAGRGWRVLRCAGDQAEARLSFVGLADLLGDAVEQELESLPAPQRDALELALLRRRGSVRGVEARAIGLGLRSLVVELARASPVVLAVDDAHWLNAATARALAFAARRLEGHAVGILATVRTGLSEIDPLRLERGLGASRFRRARLGPLSIGAVRVMIERRLGYEYSRPVLLRLAEVADGNPLFALELARALGPDPRLEPAAPLPVPDSLRALVADRVGAVGTSGRRALLAAAALSRPTTQLVEDASSAAGLAQAEEAGLLHVQGDRVVFVHPLYASAVYGSSATRTRRSLHANLADLVGDAEEQARHLALASTPPDEHIAARLEDAAARARARGAWEAAGELFEQAVRFTPPAHAERVRARVVSAAEHYVHAGDRARARELLHGVLDETPRGTIRSEALQLLAEIHHNEDGFADATRLLEEALEDADEPTVRIALHTSLGFSRSRLGDFAGADRHAEHALAEARRCGDRALLAEALAMRTMVDFLLGQGVDWANVERALALENRERLVPVQLRPSMIAALLTLYCGNLAEARARLTELRVAASDSGDESDLPFVLLWLAHLETLSGRFEDAGALTEEAAVVAALTGSEASRAWALAQRAHVHAHCGRVDETRADAAEAMESCRQLNFWHPTLWASSALALLELSLGDAAAAWPAVQPLTEALERSGVGEPDPHRFLPLALEALIALDELERAERLLADFEERALALDRIWALAAGARCRGVLLAAKGDLDGAADALQLALREHARVEMPFERARTLLVQGRVRRRRRERRAARASVEEALAVFERLGAQLWAQRARAELEPLRPHRDDDELTTAERRAVALAAEGNSNKEIAASLFISVHTVELHLSHAYAKLGIRSRAQLARRLARSEAPSLEV